MTEARVRGRPRMEYRAVYALIRGEIVTLIVRGRKFMVTGTGLESVIRIQVNARLIPGGP